MPSLSLRMGVDRGIWTFPAGGEWNFTARTRIVGILNVTPDSFSDGGLYLDPEAAVARGLAIAAEGADAIDIGGESTRPGSRPVPEDEQIARVVPVIRALRERLDRPRGHGGSELAVDSAVSPRRYSPQPGPYATGSAVDRVRISVDTSRANVAEAAIEAGAEIVNDVTGLMGDEAMAPLLARTGAAAILMHMRGTPGTMQDDPRYSDLMGEIVDDLRASLMIARNAGVRDDRIVIDPGIGFGKTADHNLEILARLSALAPIGRPVLIGASRKSFLGKVTGLPVDQRLEAGLAAAAAAVLGGASLLRVHDVAPAVRMIRMLDAIRTVGHDLR